VNTVKVTDGLLCGFNTDGDGFIRSLAAKGCQFEGRKAVILGAGGASKAIAVSLAFQKADLLILNRTPEKAKNLARQIIRLGGSADYGRLGPGEWLRFVDILIQSTPIGMKGERYLFGLEGINPLSWVVDLIYSPAVTPFLADAAACGCQTQNGLDMLIYQGALAWEIWQGMEAPLEAMRDALLSNPNGGEKE
jgi:shikimate dehydrogenase